jgi:hypothetical protein
MFKSDEEPNTIWVYAAVLDDAVQNSVAFRDALRNPAVACHIFTGGRAAWLPPIADGLPRCEADELYIVDSCKA